MKKKLRHKIGTFLKDHKRPILKGTGLCALFGSGMGTMALINPAGETVEIVNPFDKTNEKIDHVKDLVEILALQPRSDSEQIVQILSDDLQNERDTRHALVERYEDEKAYRERGIDQLEHGLGGYDGPQKTEEDKRDVYDVLEDIEESVLSLEQSLQTLQPESASAKNQKIRELEQKIVTLTTELTGYKGTNQELQKQYDGGKSVVRQEQEARQKVEKQYHDLDAKGQALQAEKKLLEQQLKSITKQGKKREKKFYRDLLTKLESYQTSLTDIVSALGGTFKKK